MPGRPFSDLPGGVHDSLRGSWAGDRPANVLLGAEETAEAAAAGIRDLSDQAHEAGRQSLANYIRERDEAAQGLVEDIFSGAEEEEPKPSVALVAELLKKHFEQAWLPLNNGALQAVVDGLADQVRHQGAQETSRVFAWFSPILTAWSDSLRAGSGTEEPELEITWPEAAQWFGQRRVSLGEGMRDVRLTINGSVQGDIGSNARNCHIALETLNGNLLDNAQGCTAEVVDTVKGSVLDGAEDCSLEATTVAGDVGTTARGCRFVIETLEGKLLKNSKNSTVKVDTVKGSVLDGAEDCSLEATTVEGSVLASASTSSVVAERIKAPYNISLGRGCTISAQTVHCKRIDVDKRASGNAPCEVRIVKLHGSIEEGEGWTVEIEEIIQPKPTPPARTERIIGESGEYKYDNMQIEKKYPSPPIKDNLINTEKDIRLQSHMGRAALQNVLDLPGDVGISMNPEVGETVDLGVAPLFDPYPPLEEGEDSIDLSGIYPFAKKGVRDE